MNKVLTLGTVVAAIIIVIYFVKRDNSTEIKIYKDDPITLAAPALNSNETNAQRAEKMETVSSAYSQSSNSSANNSSARGIEQTQNAVDFNAPGAGTAQQKAGAAAAANKAYQESKQ